MALQLLKIDMAVLQEGKSSGPVTPPRRGSQQRIRILDMDNFIDTTNIEGRFEFSEYVRAYGKYLDEQLEVFASIKFYQACHAPSWSPRLLSPNIKVSAYAQSGCCLAHPWP